MTMMGNGKVASNGKYRSPPAAWPLLLVILLVATSLGSVSATRALNTGSGVVGAAGTDTPHAAAAAAKLLRGLKVCAHTCIAGSA